MLRWFKFGLGLVIILMAQAAHAETLRSNNFQVDESFVGGSGNIESNSTNFKGADTVGDYGVGESSSSNFQTNAGYTSDADPALSFTIITGNPTFNDLSTTAAATTTSQFKVINYTSFGYAVQVVGDPPSYNGHQIPALATGTPSQAGTEQYGINLVANNSPVTLGANPDNGNPSFGFGAVASNYNTPNNYRYVSGDTIASAPKSSGATIYTISYLINASNRTPGGTYQTSHTLICTGTY